MPVGATIGSPLESPENPESPGVARPSQLLDSSSREPDSSQLGDPTQQLNQVLIRVRKMQTDLEQLAKSYPAASTKLGEANKNLLDAIRQIAASGPGQETPSPRMLG